MRTLLLFLSLLVSQGVMIRSAASEALTGTAIVIDGDSFQIGNVELSLFGIDAPEILQKCFKNKLYTCGQKSKAALIKLIQGKVVSCETQSTDVAGRTVAICFSQETTLP